VEEREFLVLADAELARIEAALAGLQDADAADFDYALKPGGIIEIECADGSKIIINRHAAAREIWLAARSGGFHFRREADRWVGTRDGRSLQEALSSCLSAQSGADLRPTW